MGKKYDYERYKSHYIVVEYSSKNLSNKKIVAHCDTVEECKEEILNLEKEAA